VSDNADGRGRAGLHWAQKPGALIALAVLLFAAIAVLRVVFSSPRDAVGVLFFVPIAALAARFGTRGGLAGALIGLLLVAMTSAISGEHTTLIGYITRAVAFVLVALALGMLTDRVDRARRFELQQLEFSPLAIIEVEQTGLIARLNHAAEHLLSLTSDELVGKPLQVVLPKRLHAAYEQARQEYLVDPRFQAVSGVEVAVCGRDGVEIPVAVNLSPVPVASGLLVRITLVDIRKQVELERSLRATAQELERSNTELDEFASVASHDLQEPLRTLSGFAQLLRKQHGEQRETEDQEFIGYILDSAKRMQDLINDLLTYSRLGRHDLQPETVDTRELVEEVTWSLAAAIDDADAEVVLHDLPCVQADRRQLEQLFQNLLSNGLKFRGHDHPRIDVAAARSGDEWEFSVADDGIGIDPAHAERVFGVFERLHARDDHEGTGMGLAICERIVERHGGRIWVEPRRGGGSVFSFTFPIPTTSPRQG
jgi:PAS domain S-box-containing protein